MHSFWEFFLFFGSIVFAVSQVENTIAKKTANKVAAQLREAGLLPPLPQPKPKPQPQRLSLRQSLTLVGLVFGLIAFIAVAGHFHPAGGAPPTAQVSTGHTVGLGWPPAPPPSAQNKALDSLLRHGGAGEFSGLRPGAVD